MSPEESRIRLLAERLEVGDCLASQDAAAIRWAAAELERLRKQVELLSDIPSPELELLVADCIEQQREGFDVLASHAWDRVAQWWDARADRGSPAQ